MKKYALTGVLFCFCLLAYGQLDERISTVDFVQILNDNREEAFYYYQHNWKKLREMAMEKGYIHSFELMETERSEDAPFDLIVITTYKDKRQYDLREDNFEELMKEISEMKLLNEKKPGEFRKSLFAKEVVRHRK